MRGKSVAAERGTMPGQRWCTAPPRSVCRLRVRTADPLGSPSPLRDRGRGHAPRPSRVEGWPCPASCACGSCRTPRPRAMQHAPVPSRCCHIFHRAAYRSRAPRPPSPWTQCCCGVGSPCCSLNTSCSSSLKCAHIAPYAGLVCGAGCLSSRTGCQNLRILGQHRPRAAGARRSRGGARCPGGAARAGLWLARLLRW